MRRSRPNAFTRNERSAIDRRRRAHAHLERVRGTNTKERPDGRTRTRLLVFGIALALLYESNASSNGMRPEEE